MKKFQSGCETSYSTLLIVCLVMIGMKSGTANLFSQVPTEMKYERNM